MSGLLKNMTINEKIANSYSALIPRDAISAIVMMNLEVPYEKTVPFIACNYVEPDPDHSDQLRIAQSTVTVANHDPRR